MQNGIRQTVEQIDQNAWANIDDYPDEGNSQIAETTYGGRRLIVRRTGSAAPKRDCGPTGATSRS